VNNSPVSKIAGVFLLLYMTRDKFIKLTLLAPFSILLFSCGEEDPRLYNKEIKCDNNLSEEEISLRVLYDYKEASDSEKEYCGRCTYWIESDEKGQCGGCTLIKGPINYGGWCRKYLASPPLFQT
jgi:hypothetical protein